MYLGALFNLQLGLIFPTEERHMKILQAMDIILQGQSVARDFLVLLGLMASCIDLIPNARLFMHPIQLHLLSFWSPAKQSLQTEIPCTPHLESHFKWWRQKANIFKGRCLQQKQTEVCITTDASKTMYGGHLGNHFVQGSWSESQKSWHINMLELEAVLLTVKHFLHQLANKSVLIKSDNTTVVQTINNQVNFVSKFGIFGIWQFNTMWN